MPAIENGAPHPRRFIWMSARRPDLLLAVIAVLFGLCDGLLLIGWHAINPHNTDWIRSDPAVFQSAWEFLRREEWTFPPTWLPKLDYPFGTSAAYLDVIPIFAVPAKLLAQWLPTDFQFFGIYLVLCLVLQTWFTLKLLNHFTSDLPELLIGALFFLNAPILLSRIYVHFSLSAQWLILAALFCYFRPPDPTRARRYVLPFLLLAFLAGGFSPYLSLMILFIAVAALFRARSSLATAGSTQAMTVVAWGVGLLLCTAASFFVFGFLSFAMQRTLRGDGYTMFSLDLFSPFDRSAFLPGPGYEGYNYLGAGVFLLLIVSLALRPGLLTQVWTTSRPLIMVSIPLVVLALSARITLAQRPLLVLPLPNPAWQALAVFRSSGRFFWPVFYLLMLGAVVSPLYAVGRKNWRLPVLLGALIIQTVDLVPVRAAVAEQFRARSEDPLNAPDWAKLGASYSHLVVLPAWQCSLTATPGGDAGWQWFAQLAAGGGMTLNSVHAARSSAQSNEYNCSTLPQQVRQGDLAPRTAYVLSDALARFAMTNGSNACRRVDGFNLCTATQSR